MNRCIIAVSLCLTLPFPTYADWTEFRGPTAQGHAAGKPPTTWGPASNIAWMAAIPGKGWSSPVVADGRVVVTTAVALSDAKSPDYSLRAVCLNATTGSQVWDVEVFRQAGATAPRIHNKNSHASATPAVHGDHVIVHFGHQGIACLKLADGAKVWENRDLTYKPVHGNGGSPVVAGGKVYFAMDGVDRRGVVALDEATGKVEWEFHRSQPAKKPFSFGTPLLVTMHGRPMLVSVGSDVVNGLDPATGKELWAQTFEGYSIVPRPVFGHGLIFLSTGYDSPVMLAVKVEPSGDRYAASIAWKSKEGAPRNASPLLVGDELYLVSDDGLASCRDARTGKVYWSERVPGAYSASLLYADGRVYLQNEKGVGTVLKAGREFEVLATNDLKEPSLASYAAEGNALLVRTDKHLYRVGK